MLTGKQILIVGGAGFVGSNLVRRCLNEGACQVVVVDNLLSSEASNLPKERRVELRIGSVADGEVLRGIEDTFDIVYHLATYHGNQNSIAEPLADHENNLTATVK